MKHRVVSYGEQTSLGWRKTRAGQRMFIGFQGTSVNDDLRRVVKEIQPAGFVLFRRNVEEPEQVLELNRELRSLCRAEHPAFIAVDQEGGRVQRVKTPATVWPPMRHVGAAKDITADVSQAIAKELHAMGFNLNFAPVADVDSNPNNPIIGDRAFGTHVTEVAAHLTAFIQAHQASGIIACAKHFPGHGDTSVDSHLDLPWVDRAEAGLRAIELPPFQAAIQAGVATIMTSHVMYPSWDDEYPATLSKKILRGILREELGFDGVVFSDDLEMKAIAGRYSVEEQVCRMTEASVDIFLCCEDHQLQLAVYREQMLMQETFPTLEDAAKASERRIQTLRETHLSLKPTAFDLTGLGCPEHKALAATASERAADLGLTD